MPEGVEIKAKITKGGKGAKKRKADGSVGSPYKRPEQPDIQDDDTPSAGGQSDSEEEQKPKISTPRQKAAARVKVEQEDVESPIKKVSPCQQRCLQHLTDQVFNEPPTHIQITHRTLTLTRRTTTISSPFLSLKPSSPANQPVHHRPEVQPGNQKDHANPESRRNHSRTLHRIYQTLHNDDMKSYRLYDLFYDGELVLCTY